MLTVKLMIVIMNRQGLSRSYLKSNRILKKMKSYLQLMKISIKIWKNKKSLKPKTITNIVHMNKFLKKKMIVPTLMTI